MVSKGMENGSFLFWLGVKNLDYSPFDMSVSFIFLCIHVIK